MAAKSNWSRRRLLRVAAGAGGLLLAAGGWRAYDRGVFRDGHSPAYALWNEWPAGAPPGPLGAVHAAVLAANPHNTQPWRFLLRQGRIVVDADLSRNLGAMDPFRRELYIGLGCALENLSLAAAVRGWRAEPTLLSGRLGLDLPREGTLPAAEVRLAPQPPRSGAMGAAIGRRHTNRGPYALERPVPASVLDALRALAAEEPAARLHLLTAPEARAGFAARCVAATEAIIGDATMAADSNRWYRGSWEEIERHRDGPTLESSIPLSPLLLATARMLPAAWLTDETNNSMWLQATRDLGGDTPVFGVLSVADKYDRVAALRVGMLWQRLHLTVTSQGLAAAPVNQVMEMDDRERELGRLPTHGPALDALLGHPGGAATFAFRLGYPLRVAPASPRRSLRAVVAIG